MVFQELTDLVVFGAVFFRNGENRLEINSFLPELGGRRTEIGDIFEELELF